MSVPISRRSALGKIAGSTFALGAVATLPSHAAAEVPASAPWKGRIHQSVCRWCYQDISLDELCKAARSTGLQLVELAEVKDFPALKRYDLICAMVTGVPGRGEIDETQEIQYPAAMRAILDTGFQGIVAQEFEPKGPDAVASLRQGVHICDV